jgi:hypothetical protein
LGLAEEPVEGGGPLGPDVGPGGPPADGLGQGGPSATIFPRSSRNSREPKATASATLCVT